MHLQVMRMIHLLLKCMLYQFPRSSFLSLFNGDLLNHNANWHSTNRHKVRDIMFVLVLWIYDKRAFRFAFPINLNNQISQPFRPGIHFFQSRAFSHGASPTCLVVRLALAHISPWFLVDVN